MNTKNIFAVMLTAVALTATGQIASAYERDNDQREYGHNPHRGNDDRGGWNHDTRGRLDREINHLDRMLEHVDRKLNRYGAGRHLRREFYRVRSEARRLIFQYRQSERPLDPRRLRAQIERLHNELHDIERKLRVRTSEWYQWR